MPSSKSPESLTQFKPRRARRFLRLLFVLGILLLVALWFVPQIAMTDAVRQWLLAKALPGSPAKVQFSSAAVGWFSPIEIEELTVADENEAVIRVGRLTTNRTLLQLVTQPKDLGTIRLEAPQVHVVIQQDGTNNVARLLGEQTAVAADDESKRPSLPTALKLEVTDGRLLVTDNTLGREFAAENMALFANLPTEGVEPLSVDLTAIALDAGQQGSLNAQMKWWPPQPGQSAGEGNAVVQAEQFPITLATAIAGAAGVQLQGTGLVDASVQCDWTEDANGVSIPLQALVKGSNLAITVPELNGDTLQTSAAQLEINALVDRGKLVINRLHAESDHGMLDASGAAPISAFSTAATETLVPDHQLEIDGVLDLPRLAAQLGNTLHLRDDAEITEGQARLLLTSSGAEGRHTIRSQVSSKRLVGRVAGTPIEWNEALSMDLAASRANGKLTIDQAVCETPFAVAQLSGDETGGNISGQSDLSALVAQLGQFVDFGQLQLAGTANTQGNWRYDGHVLTVNLDTDCRDLVVANGGERLLQEPKLATRIDCRVATDQQSIQRIESANAQISAGADQLLVRLKQPVDAPCSGSVWPVFCRLSGGLVTWKSRLAALEDWDVAGDVDVEADGWICGSQFELPNLTAKLTNLLANAGSTRVHEPIVQLNGNLSGDLSSMHLQVKQLAGTSSILAINSQDIDISFPGGKPAVSGVCAFRGDVGRLTSLLMPEGGTKIVGKAEGQLNLQPSGEAIRVEGHATCENFAMFGAPPAGPAVYVEGQQVGKEITIWGERSLRIDLRGNWLPADDVAQLDQLTVTGDEATLDLHGQLAQLTMNPVADLSGSVRYDLAVVSRKLNAERPTGILLAGAHQGELTISGPLLPSDAPTIDTYGQPIPAAPISPDLVAKTTLAWDSANLYGVIVGPQQLNVELNQGVLATSAIDAEISGGQLRATPMLDFRRQPLALTLAGETTLQNAQLTPEFCDQWLKYIAPLIAGAATANGDFSVVLNQASIPLNNPQMADLAGRLVVGAARVQPGPMAQTIYTASQDFTSLLSRGNSPFSFMAPDQKWLELSNQQVDFQMTQGRIYHQNLTLSVGDVQVASRGWVGLDQSVAMVTEIPVQDKWLGSSDLLAGLRGQTIQVPIHGTLTRPQLDRRALSQLSTQLIGNTADRLLEGQLQKGLQKLLGPK